MTLQEVKDQIARKHGYGAWEMKIYENGDEMMETILEEVAHLIHSEACREQREICANTFDKSDGPVIGSKKVFDAIKNAPEPTLL